MKTFIFILLSFSLTAQFKPKDDALHFYAGFGIQQITSSIIHNKTKKIWLSCLAGGVAGVGAGVAKEFVYDRDMHRGTFDKNDMLMTAWGTFCGIIITRVTIDFLDRKKNKKYMKF
jgi:hypothetical protein